MKILHLLYESQGDYFGVGGVAVRAYRIYDILKERHHITLLCKRYPGAADRKLRGIQHLFAGVESKSLTWTLLAYARSAARFVHDHAKEFDVIIEEFSPPIPTCLHGCTSTPVILQMQGYTGKEYFRKYNPLSALFLYSMEHLRPRLYRSFLCITHESVKILKPQAGSVVEVIPNGIPPDILEIEPEEGDYILYLGRIDIYGKGLDLLIDAYSAFFISFPRTRLVIAGEGKDMDMLRKMIGSLGAEVRSNITLCGWASETKKADLLQKALFVVFPSRHEVQPIALLEAMGYAKAVLVSDITAFSHVPARGAGLVFRSGDASSLSRAMGELVNCGRKRDMGQQARSWVKDLTWERIALQYEAFLEKVRFKG
jgi:glycosyltransferase involved in cell wall biosynthesis